MVIFKFAILFTALLTLTGAAPHEQKPLGVVTADTPRPVVIWHGLGDTSTGSGMAQFKEDLEGIYPGIHVMNVKIPAGGTLDDERKAGFVSWGRQASIMPWPDVVWPLRYTVGQCDGSGRHHCQGNHVNSRAVSRIWSVLPLKASRSRALISLRCAMFTHRCYRFQPRWTFYARLRRTIQ